MNSCVYELFEEHIITYILRHQLVIYSHLKKFLILLILNEGGQNKNETFPKNKIQSNCLISC